MATLSNSLISSSSRPLRLRSRADLLSQLQRYQGRTYWVVKDPIALTYFRFQEEEFAILQMMDGNVSLDQIKRRFERKFPPQKITVEELDRLVGMLHRSSLVVSDARGQGSALNKRGSERKRKELLGKFTNVLAMRFKGIDPDRLLNWLDPYIGWFFNRGAVLVSLVLALTALILVTVQWDAFHAKLPTFNEFFASKNWLWLALTLSVTKILHEFGHGLSCKHFRGECHEMGVMILVLTPCLYCNVSDSWMLPNKWHRAAIGAAGMYVELVLASISTFIWWFSEPGLLHYLALNVMFISSVSTILFNGNPLLRFDGYYILSDIVEIPNLRQKSSSVLNRLLGSWFLGLEPQPDPFLPEQNQIFFAAYTVAAALYRWIIVLSILMFLNRVFEPYGLRIIGQLIACMAMYGLIIMPLWKVYKFFHVPGRIEKVKKARMFGSLGMLVVVVAAILLIPVPFHVVGTLELQPRGAEPIYIEVAGNLSRIHDVRYGDHVEQSQPIVTLDNIDLRVSVEQLEGKWASQLAHVESLIDRALIDDAAGFELDSAQEALTTIETHLAIRKADLARLKVTAPVSGIMIPPPAIFRSAKEDGKLPSWQGTPLEQQNIGAYLAQGVPICHVGDPGKLEAIIVIDQADIEFVRAGQDVELYLEGQPGEVITSKIEQVSKQDLQTSPRGLSNKAGGGLPTTTDATGRERPMSITYQASAMLDDTDAVLYVRTRGKAKINAGYRTLATRIWRYLSHTFNFEL